MTKDPKQEGEIYAVLAAAQAEFKNPEKTKDGHVSGTSKSGNRYEYTFKYADIGDVLEILLPVLSKHGLAMTQPTEIRGEMLVLKTILHYNSEKIESEYPVCSLNGNHQSMGAAMTYARRYALTSLAGIAAVEDTDGAGAAPVGDGGKVKMTASQAATEVNWEKVQSAIDQCDTFKALDNRAELVEQRKGTWPDAYYWKAVERITARRLELAQQRLADSQDADQLSDAFTDVEVILDGKVPQEDLAELYRVRLNQLELNPIDAG